MCPPGFKTTSSELGTSAFMRMLAAGIVAIKEGTLQVHLRTTHR